MIAPLVILGVGAALPNQPYAGPFATALLFIAGAVWMVWLWRRDRWGGHLFLALVMLLHPAMLLFGLWHGLALEQVRQLMPIPLALAYVFVMTLILQRDVHRASVGTQAPRGLAGIPARCERIGTEVADQRLLGGRRHDGDVGEVEAHRLPLRAVGCGRPDDGPRLERGIAPALAASVDVPFALHLEVRVQRLIADPVQQVLPA